MKVFISSDSFHNFFIDKVTEVIEKKSQQLFNLASARIKRIYPPSQRGRATQTGLLEKISKIKEADLVIMNITPLEIDGQFFVNSGVLIEYGILVGLDELNKLSIFCEERYPLETLSPLFHGRDIQSFATDDNGEQLKERVRPIIEDCIKVYIGQARRIVRGQKTAQEFIRHIMQGTGTQE